MFDLLNAILALLSPATEGEGLTAQSVVTSLTMLLEELLAKAEEKMGL